jgi:hypothetical protein
MNIKLSILLLLGLSLTVIHCDSEAADEFDDGVVVTEDDEEVCRA